MPTYGTAGSSDSGASTRTTKDKWGAKGERRTAKLLLRSFEPVANVFVFHDLNIPSARRPHEYEPANIDHAILTGDRLLLIDSKNWAPGVYWTIPFANRSYRGVKRFAPADTRTLGMAKDRYKLWLPDNVKISTVTAVWSTKPGWRSLIGLRSRDGTRFVPGQRIPFVAAMWLGAPAPPDPESIDRLLAWTRNP